ncbi:hypothetical protein [Fundidesulfovibrio agrisoli]|uniref:hypothetical protein n=1 Tax=Fundidesulfovibrio agrisoli TaxID=2922717 RepID=UPI001FAC24BE|nr:hypothetical protein [Fundidesulfovibrio agrisoli]
MSVAFIMPTCPVSPGELERIVRRCAYAMPVDGATFVVTPTTRAIHRNLPAAYPLTSLEEATGMDFGHVVVIQPDEGLEIETKAQCFIISNITRATLEHADRKPHPEDTPALASHTFGRQLLASPHSGFAFMPVGYAYSQPVGSGPTDAFGFRIDRDVNALRTRESHQKVVAVFGGSSTWGTTVMHHETFCHQLELLLNQASQERGEITEFIVLNFGIHNAVVLNQHIFYLLFCEKIRPDVVIGHDGFNDFYNGLVTDTYLLREHRMTHPYVMESWPQRLYGPSVCGPASVESVAFADFNLPNNIIHAYVERKKQFLDHAASAGAHVIWGLQPISRNKKALSELEASEIKRIIAHYGIAQSIRATENVYDLFAQHVTIRSYEFIDFPRVFAELGPEDTHFFDFCHMSPLGEAVIAEVYAKTIGGRFLRHA